MDRTTPPVDPLAVGRLAPQGPTSPDPRPAAGGRSGETSFEHALQQASEETEPLRFSKHAQLRLQERGVALDARGLQRLEGAVDQAASKGARDSLVLMDDLALIVSVRNRTVVTAVDAASRKGNVFTNIDSVVLAE